MCRADDFPPYPIAHGPRPELPAGAHWSVDPATMAVTPCYCPVDSRTWPLRRVVYTEAEDVPPPEWRDPADVYRDRA